MRLICSQDTNSSGLSWKHSKQRFVLIVNNLQICMNLPAATITTTTAIRGATLARWPIHTFSAVKIIAMIPSAGLPTTKFSSYIILQGTKPNTAKAISTKKGASITSTALSPTPTTRSRYSYSTWWKKIFNLTTTNTKLSGAPIPTSTPSFTKARSIWLPLRSQFPRLQKRP